MADPPAVPSLATRLRTLTPARVGLGRAGPSQPTRSLLDFGLAHARARDAVHGVLPEDFAAGLDGIEVRSGAGDRPTYLRRPDLGRRLEAADRRRLGEVVPGNLAIVLADGLSARAAVEHGPPLVEALRRRLTAWPLAPLVVARQARVALGDEIGEVMGARAVVMLIGERPGLTAPASLGAYVTWAPRVGRMDSERNCISNIREPDGLPFHHAAERIAAVLEAAATAGCTGVALGPVGDAPVLADSSSQ